LSPTWLYFYHHPKEVSILSLSLRAAIELTLIFPMDDEGGQKNREEVWVASSRHCIGGPDLPGLVVVFLPVDRPT